MFSSFSIRDFRLYWCGMFVSLIGTWIQAVAQSWLVFELTRSAWLMGCVGFLGSVPILLLTLFAGAVADRVNKRSMLIVTQCAFTVLAAALALLTQLHYIAVWHIMVIALLNGAVMAFDAPSRQAMVVELVGKKHLMNAIALNSAAFNAARIIGPALAGIMVAVIGMSGCFFLNAISFLPILAVLLIIRNRHVPRPESNMGIKAEMYEGIRFIIRTRTLLMLILLVGAISLFGVSYMILMPIVADEVLHMGIGGLGLLMSWAGAGALVAALILARVSYMRHRGRLLMVACGVFTVCLVAFSFSRSAAWSCGLIACVGWASVTAVSLVNTILQTLVPDALRGRAMSAYMFTFAGVLPLGNVLSGGLAHVVGVPHAIALSGSACAIVCAVIFARNKQIVQL